MQYILSEEEMRRGKQLIESWRVPDLALEEVHKESENLIS